MRRRSRRLAGLITDAGKTGEPETPATSEKSKRRRRTRESKTKAVQQSAEPSARATRRSSRRFNKEEKKSPKPTRAPSTRKRRASRTSRTATKDVDAKDAKAAKTPRRPPPAKKATPKKATPKPAKKATPKPAKKATPKTKRTPRVPAKKATPKPKNAKTKPTKRRQSSMTTKEPTVAVNGIDERSAAKRTKHQHLVQLFDINETVEANYEEKWHRALILEVQQRTDEFHYLVEWLEDSKSTNDRTTSIVTQSNLRRADELGAGVGFDPTDLVEEAKPDMEQNQIGLEAKDERIPLVQTKTEQDEKNAANINSSHEVDPPASVPTTTSSSAVPNGIAPSTTHPNAPKPIEAAEADRSSSNMSRMKPVALAVSGALLVAWTTCDFCNADYVFTVVAPILAYLLCAKEPFLSEALMLTLVARYLCCFVRLGAWWDDVVAVIGSLCFDTTYVCQRVWPLQGIQGSMLRLLAIGGQPTVFLGLTFISALARKHRPTKSAFVVLGSILSGCASFWFVSIVFALIYWLLFEPLFHAGVSLVTFALPKSGLVDQPWSWPAIARLVVTLLGIGVCWFDYKRIMRVIAHFYVHYVRSQFYEGRVRDIHRYAKQSDDTLPSFLMNIHMRVLSTIERPFRAKVDSRRFMKKEDGKASKPIARKLFNWFGLANINAKKKRLGELLVKHHSIPSGALRDFKRVPLQVDRMQVFDSVAEQVLAADPEDLAAGINVKFGVEQGMDAGGLTKEFFNIICNGLLPEEKEEVKYTRTFRPVLRRQSSVKGVGEPMLKALPDTCMMLAKSSRPIMFYNALGRVFGMCVASNCRGENTTVPVSLSTALLKFLLAHEINHNDVRALDPIYFKNRIESILSDGGVEFMCMILGEDKLFFVDLDSSEELKEGGASIEVTEQNKQEYVTLLSENYLCGQVRQQVCQFLQGFHEIVPLQMMQQCNIDETDLGLLLSGIPNIDPDDWERNTAGSVAAHQPSLVQWFFEIVKEMPQDDRARILQFVTGLTRLPLAGFRDLKPMFKLDLNTAVSHEHLPTAHTCFNKLSLPPYESKEELRSKLKKAVNMASNDFSLR